MADECTVCGLPRAQKDRQIKDGECAAGRGVTGVLNCVRRGYERAKAEAKKATECATKLRAVDAAARAYIAAHRGMVETERSPAAARALADAWIALNESIGVRP